jgi:hypothetical protein
METMLGISLYSYPYLNYQKRFVFLIIAYVFLFNKIRDKGRTGSAWKWGDGGERERGRGAGVEMAQIMCAHMNK